METPICEFWIMNFILEKWDDHCRFCAEIMSRTVTKQFSWLIYSWCIVSPAFLGETWWNNISVHDRRKFRSQTSDNMDRWKSRDGKGQRREEQKREDQRRERVRRKKMQVREKVEKSQFTVSFQWFVAAEGRKVGSLKRRVRSHVARWEMKTCTPLWREAYFQLKMYKTHHSGTTFGGLSCRKCTPVWREANFEVKNARNISMSKHFWKLRCRKVHAVVARSTFRSQNVQNTPPSKHFWKLRCRKSARRCGAKHLSKSKVQNADGYGSLLDVQMSFCVAGARDCAPCQKWAKHEGFVTVSTKSTTTLHPTPLHYSYNYDYVYDYSTLHYAN